jgi:gliding motility-associated-like protein
MKRTIFLLFIIFMAFGSQGQEICDNGIDDDFDGLIDLNDEECYCERLLPNSLIPNPSFEDRTCCPEENARLDCAVDWIQASAPTTDYVHTCGNYLGNTNIPAYAPLPFPDGEGGVGFRDGQQHVGPNYKEYVGACLTEAMQAGTRYRLDFYVGFRDNVAGSMDLEMAIFAATSCSFLPFGGNSNTIGCPVNTGFYTEIGKQKVSGNNEWVNVVFEFVADQAYEVLILGPACGSNPNYTLDPYFYLDRLAFAESKQFGEPFSEIEGSICDGGLRLAVAQQEGYEYQWYKDGIALTGENESWIFLTPDAYEEGLYLVRISTEDGCFLSQDYELRIPPYYETLVDSICSNESYWFGDLKIDTAGYYERRIEALDGCDSIIQLTLDVIPTTDTLLLDTICHNESFSYLDIFADQGGQYETTINNLAGCDSTIRIALSQLPMGDQIHLPPDQEIDLGESIDIIPLYIDPDYSAIYWTAEDGGYLTEELNITSFRPLESTQLFLHATDGFGCPVMDSISIRVNKSNYTLYIPNVFTPNGDHLNDYFNFQAPLSLDHIVRFIVFDRWGNKMYQSSFPDRLNGDWGWDGNFRGKEAPPGVYTYMIEAVFIDGYSEIFSGDVSLLR